MEETEKAFMAIKCQKSSAPDGLPNWALCKFAGILGGTVCAKRFVYITKPTMGSNVQSVQTAINSRCHQRVSDDNKTQQSISEIWTRKRYKR